MPYYLSEFVGDGTPHTNPFQAPVDGRHQIIDLRGDAKTQAGRCLLWTPADLPNDNRYEKVADETVESIPRNIARRIERALGVTLDQFDTLQAIIAELLILHGSFTDSGRWNPLQANRFRRHVIHLGGKIYDAPVPVGVTLTDDFNRPNSFTLGNLSGGTGTWVEEHGDSEIFSNRVNFNTGSTLHQVYADAALDTTIQYAEAEVYTDGSGSVVGAVAVRVAVNTSQLDGFAAYIADASPDLFILRRLDAGSETNLTVDEEPFVDGELIRVEADGSTITGFYGGVEINSATDTNHSDHTLVGFLAFDENDQFIDNFEGGDLGAGGTTVAIGTLAQTDTPVGVGAEKPIDTAVGTLAQSDTQIGVAAAKQASIGVLAQSDSLVSVSGLKTAPVGVLAETDSLVTVPPLKAIEQAVGVLAQTDTLRSIGGRKTADIGVLAETDALISVSGLKLASIGTLAETDALVAVQAQLGGDQTIAVGTLAVLEALIAVTVDQPSVTPVGTLAQTDSLITVSGLKTADIGTLAELESLITITSGQQANIGVLAETDQLIAVSSLTTAGIRTLAEENILIAVVSGALTFWAKNPTGYTLAAVAYTAEPAAYVPAEPDDPPPW